MKRKLIIASAGIGMVGLIGFVVTLHTSWIVLLIAGIVVEYTVWLGMDE